MEDTGKKTTEQLLIEVARLRERIAELDRPAKKPGKDEIPRDQSDWLELAQEAASAGFWSRDMVTGQSIWSEGLYRLFGLAPGVEASTETWMSILHPDDREAVLARLNNSTTQGSPLASEHRIILPDGRQRWISVKGNIFRDDTGRPLRMCGICIDITDRKEMEDALRQSEQLYRAIGESINYGVWVCSPDGQNIYTSPPFLKMAGLTQQECTELGWRQVLHPDDVDRTTASWKDCLKTGRTWDSEHRFLGADGRFHHILARGIPIHDTLGEITCWVGINLDMDNIKEAEQKLFKQAQFVSAVLDTAGALVMVLDRQGRINLFNRACEKITGYTAAEVLGRVVWETLIPPEEMPGVMDAWQKLAAGDFPGTYENHWLARDGSRRLITWSNTALTDETKEVQYIIATGLDITDRKRMEEELRRSRDELELRVEERTRELMKSEETARFRLMEIETYYNMIPIGLAIIDRELRYVRINERLAEMNGLPAAAHVGKTIRELLPGMADPTEELAHRILQTGESLTDIEFTGETAARPGIRRTYRESWFPFKDSSGQVSRVGIMVEDITQQRRLEEQLRQSQKMEAIGTLAGGIAHDFNNILAAIIGFAEMVEEDLPEDSRSKARIRRVLNAASRGRDLVRQILAFSRKTEPTRESLSLSSIIEETVQLLRASLPTTIEIDFTTKASKDMIHASPAEVQQILMNLATNAASAMRDKSGTITIGLVNIDFEPDSPILDDDVEGGEYIQIVVTDTGTGMTPDIMKRVFEPFYTTKQVGEGTGMGLAVVYGIVKNLKGTVTVESEPGAGSTFRVFLPVARAHKEPEDGEAQANPKGTERILFVDDEEMLAQWGKDALERLGYRVTAFTDSLEALRLFSADPSAFDLVIADQTMPGLTGINLARKLLALRDTIPIILCTGHSDSVSPEKAHEAGIREFLLKPLERKELSAAIRRVLDGVG